MMNLLITLALILFLSTSGYAADKGSPDLPAESLAAAQNDIYPLDLLTARTLKKREIIFSPLGYLFYGITDKLNLELDFYVIAGGSLIGNLKYTLTDGSQKLPQIALNFMYLYLSDEKEVADTDDFEVDRDDNSFSIDVIFTKTFSSDFSLSS